MGKWKNFIHTALHLGEPSGQEEDKVIGKMSPQSLDGKTEVLLEHENMGPEASIGRDTEVPSEKNEGVISGVRHFQVGIAQIIGTREHQEDSYCVSNWKDAEVIGRQGLLAAVADGIGGLSDGEVASNTLMHSIRQGFGKLPLSMSAPDKLLSLVAAGQADVLELNHRGYHCGTTLVCTLIQDGCLYLISAGDSRISLYRRGALLQLNREHVLGKDKDEERAFLNQEDTISPMRRRALTSYIGKEDFHEVDRTLTPMRLMPGDKILLMSDGVFGSLGEDQMLSLLDREPQQAADAIISAIDELASARQDNATIVIISYE